MYISNFSIRMQIATYSILYMWQPTKKNRKERASKNCTGET